MGLHRNQWEADPGGGRRPTGMALFNNKNQVEQILEGTDDLLVVFKELDRIDYYFLAAWEQEKGV